MTALADPDQPLLDIRTRQQRRPSIWALAAAGAVEVEAGLTDPAPVAVQQASEPGGEPGNQAAADEDWTHAQELMDAQEVFETRVTGYNLGGVTITLGRLRGFIPNSHLSTIQPEMDAEQQQNELSKLVGKMIPVRIIEVQRKRRRLVLSERLAERAWRDKQRDHILGELQVGQRVTGRVRSLTSFGVFVDIGGADGLVHLSELTRKRIKHPREVVKVGQELVLEVIRVERERGRVGLSLKHTQADPWADIEARYHPGQLITARITNLVSFGAFATVEPGVEGLVHISELSDDYIEHPRQVVQRGQDYTMRVLAIDREHERVSLSLRQAPQWIEAPSAATNTEEDTHDG
ncbi:S1 RNA-binding domain-containing protein [Candidatus Amarolinea dominans]|nr:S1 RNA-binding domain-containing protein [Anaerolineae bacterium]